MCSIAEKTTTDYLRRLRLMHTSGKLSNLDRKRFREEVKLTENMTLSGGQAFVIVHSGE